MLFLTLFEIKMKLLETDFVNQIIKTVENKMGDVYFFENIAVVELREGVHFDMNNSATIINELESYFGNTKPYGIVANRINSYSINLMDAPHFRTQAKNLKAYGVVGHDLASKMNAEIENGFCVSEKIDYNTITEAIKTVSEKVKSSMFSLN